MEKNLTNNPKETSEIWVDQARAIVESLRPVKPLRYGCDIGASALVGWGVFLCVPLVSSFWLSALLFAVACLALYRALAFIHELFHQQHYPMLHLFWHILVGIPLLLPLLLYLPIHQSHHNAQTYGTVLDGEYEQLKGGLWGVCARLLIVNIFLPLALVVRFGLLTPLGVVVPWVQQKLIPSFIHLSMRMPFVCKPVSGRLKEASKMFEWGCMLWSFGIMGALGWGWHSWVGLWAVLLIVIATLNTLRTLCSTHLYVEEKEGRNTHGQVVDGINVEGGILTFLMCPAGLQYHALHHLAPYLPYHALPEAHRRLIKELPVDSPYHEATVQNLASGWLKVKRATLNPI